MNFLHKLFSARYNMSGERYAVLKWLILVLAVAGSIWLVQVTAPAPEVITRPPQTSSDYFAEHATTNIMDAAGQVRYRVRADRIDHFPSDDHSDLVRPLLTLFHAGTPTWLIRADHARVSAKGEEVWLLGQVQVRQPPGADNLELDSANVLLRPAVQSAETERAVEIRHPRQVLDAVGMRVYLEEKRVELLHNVRGRYDPPSSAATP